MLSSEDFIKFILSDVEVRVSSPKSSLAAALPEGFEGFDADDIPPPPSDQGASSFARRLLEASDFGYAELVQRDSVIRSSDAVAKYLPDRASYWPKTATRPYQTLLFEANLKSGALLKIPAFRSSELRHLNDLEAALARLVSEALEGFQRGGEGVTADVRKGRKEETLCIISIIDERESLPVRLVCFGTWNKRPKGGLETFQISEQTRLWDLQLAREHLGLLYERQFKRLTGADWQDAFTTTEERKQAEKLLAVCTRKSPEEKDIQESVLDLLDTIAKGFGLRKKNNAIRRLQAFTLPSDHDIGIDPEEREGEFGGANPFGGVTLRDERSRLLGYIIYPLKTKADADRLQKHLAENNRFHNVLVVYPDVNQAKLELWQGREQLTGKLRKGQGYKDAADVVNLLSRFFVVSKAKVRNPTELAQELAYRARYLRRLAMKQLAEETNEEPLRKLYNDFKEALVHNQTEAEFADAFAQTLTYGLLTARWMGNDQLVEAGERFNRQTALRHLPATSPFLNDLFRSALSVKLDEQRGRLLWLVDDIADLLDRIDVTYVFGAGDAGSDRATDPVIHFYEPFLAAYDKELKNKRGVFFTPRPVVSYIVRSVHELLQTEFGLEDGLASTATWGAVAERVEGLTIPNGVTVHDPFVCILDPATGTGTFLFECIDIIERTMKERWCRELGAKSWSDTRVVARWISYVPNSLLPRIYGFELMMASYAVAHLKLSFKLGQTGCELRSEDRLHVFLTNSLEPTSTSQGELEGISPALAAEAKAVENVKNHRRFTVVLGNPPYSNYSANLSDQAKAIVNNYRCFGGAPIRERNQLQFERNLQDDFVKFISIGENELRRSGIGVLGYITNATMLASSSLRGMREHLLREFSVLHELHLHGGVNEIGKDASEDQNVFDIAQAVGIHIYLRKPNQRLRSVKFSELWGSRTEKYSYLQQKVLTDTNWRAIRPDSENCAFVPQDDSDQFTMARLDDVFVKFGAGIKTNRDAIAIAFSEEELIEAVKDFSPALISRAKSRDAVRSILYRPFDQRVIFYHEDVVASRSLPTMQHILAGPNVGLIASSTWTTPELFSVSAARTMIEMKTGTHDRGTTFFPLYRYESILGGPFRRTSNLKIEFCNQWETHTGARLTASERGNLTRTSGPEDVLCWTYGLCHSPEYRSRLRAQLAQGFPLVLFPRDQGLLAKVIGLGKRLLDIHMLEDAAPTSRKGIGVAFVGAPNPEVEKLSYSANTVWLDKAKTKGFSGVSQDVWAFHMGGYPVCEKWLKDRRGRMLSNAEIDHYIRMVRALQETILLMKEVDRVIEEHGGWPSAFLTKEKQAS